MAESLAEALQCRPWERALFTTYSLSEALAAEASDMVAFLNLAKNSSLWSPFQLIERIQQSLRLRETAVVPYALRGLLVCAQYATLMQSKKVLGPNSCGACQSECPYCS